MNGLTQRVLALLKFLRGRTFAVGMLSTALAGMVLFVSEKTNAVYIRDGEEVALKFTVKQEAEDILSQYGIATMAYDSVNFSGFSGKVAEIDITRGFPVYLTADGKTVEKMITGATVGQFLKDQGIELGPDDELNLSPARELEEGDHIIVTRVEITQRVEEEVLPHKTHVKETSLLKLGKQKVLSYGSDGLKQYIYTQRTVDGVLLQEELEEENILKQPIDAQVLAGTGAAISDLDFGYPMSGDGKPLVYRDVITEAVATGYSARAGAGTASGRLADVGHVAVDPNIIPYGTKLYITSRDNSFVYGYAIASDTGTGLLDGTVDIDLFYDTYYESCLNGRRIVDIYILE